MINFATRGGHYKMVAKPLSRAPYSWQLKTQVISTDQIFIWGGGGTVDQVKPKFWPLWQFSFPGGVHWTKSNSKSQPLWQFSFSAGEGYSGPSQTRSPNLSDNFHFQVGWGWVLLIPHSSNTWVGALEEILQAQAMSCITDAKLCVETNEHEPSSDNKGINDNKLNNSSELSLRKRGTLSKMLSLTTRKMTMQKNRHLTAMHPHQSCLL